MAVGVVRGLCGEAGEAGRTVVEDGEERGWSAAFGAGCIRHLFASIATIVGWPVHVNQGLNRLSGNALFLDLWEKGVTE